MKTMIDLTVERDVRRVVRVITALSRETSRPVFVDREAYDFVLEHGYAVFTVWPTSGYTITRKGRDLIRKTNMITE